MHSFTKLNWREFFGIPHQIECCPNNDQFQLVVLSNYSNVYLFDIRTMKVIEKLELNADYGCTISMVLDDKNNLLFFGTVSGIIEMWDARYFVQIRAWTFGESLPINKLAIMEQENKSLLVVCGGVDSAFFTLWNIEKLSCKHVFVRSNEQPSWIVLMLLMLTSWISLLLRRIIQISSPLFKFSIIRCCTWTTLADCCIFWILEIQKSLLLLLALKWNYIHFLYYK